MKEIFNFFTNNNSSDLVIFLFISSVKASLIIGFAALIIKFFKNFSAANRHFIWFSVLFAALFLPLFSLVKGWEISVLPSQTSSVNQEISGNSTTQISKTPVFSDLKISNNLPQSKVFTEPLLMPNVSNLPAETVQNPETVFSISFFGLILSIWLVGMCLYLLKLLIGIVSTKRITRQTNKFENPALNNLFSTLLNDLNLNNNIRLLRSEKTMMPIVCGIIRPAVILPAMAEMWTDERCKVVLLHELTHISRRDCLTQFFGQLAFAIYWFNPLVWFATRQLRIEREHACDEFVLSLGTKPSDYACHLLDIARSANNKNSGFEWAPNATIAMAQQSQLEERLLAILTPKNQRKSRYLTAGIFCFIVALFLSLAVIHPTTIEANNSMISQTSPDFIAKDNKQSAENPALKVNSEIPNILTNKSAEKEKPQSVEETVETRTDEIVNEQINKENKGVKIDQTTEHQQTENDSELKIEPSPNPNLYVKAELNQNQEMQTSDDFIDEMASVGYKNLSIDELIRLKSIGVNAEYVKALRAAGFDNLTVKELVSLRAVGVTPKYVEEIRNAGYKELSIRELSNLKALGVSSDFINKFKKAGYEEISLRDLTNLKASNMTLEYIDTMNSLGFGKLSLREVVNLKFIGITPAFVRLAKSRLGNDLTLKQIVSLKNAGILTQKEKP
ncbi:MAG: M56 family metallopeptidase [Pyrinomonadaceae bacterium]|nr:M56 family metallopeptidase [Pyrinomonadaceae bacterium]